MVLVDHRWRAWVPPGGAAEPGETPRKAALRELTEETSLVTELEVRPAAVAVRSYHPDWARTLGLSYVAFVEPEARLVGEPDQPVEWRWLSDPWESYFPADRQRMLQYVSRLQG